MEYSFTDAPINNQPAAEPKKESKIKPIHILYIIGALIVILIGVIAINAVINHMNEQQRIAEEEQQHIEEEQQREHDAVMAELDSINRQYSQIAGGDDSKAKKNAFERTATEYINNQEKTTENRAYVATLLANFWGKEERYDEAIDLINEMLELEDIPNASQIDCMLTLADIYGYQEDKESEIAVLEQILALPEHEVNGMPWENGKEMIIKSRIKELSEEE